MKLEPARGACLCGGVVFTMRFPSKWVAHCHCTRCQRAHGAAFVTWVSVAAEQVGIDDPRGLLRWYRAEGGAERGFCSHCGSSLFFRAGDWPGELHIARAMFPGPLDREPQMHGFYDTHVPWVQLADGLPTKPDPHAKGPATAPAAAHQFLYLIRPTRPAMLSAGPTEREASVVAEHFRYLQKLEAQGVLLMAGRTTQGDERTFGIVVFVAASEAEAEAVMRADPAVRDGVMTSELFPYRVALWSRDGPAAAG
jgi:uncharacterized protein YciI